MKKKKVCVYLNALMNKWIQPTLHDLTLELKKSIKKLREMIETKEQNKIKRLIIMSVFY